MIPAPFEYARPSTLGEALELLARGGPDAKVLAGGHSLLPAMKLRLAQPRLLIDIGRLDELRFLRAEGDRIAIGALVTHHELEASTLVRERCPLVAETAGAIGDVQVRNRGTLGGSLVHADPAADWPAAVLALGAELELVGPAGRRTVPAEEFFVGLLETATGPGEILAAVRVPRTPPSVAYEKFAQKASGFAIAGAAVVLGREPRVGITGVAPKPYRARAVEAAFGREGAGAAQRAAADVEPLGDLHASAEFRAHLARVVTRRALERALERA